MRRLKPFLTSLLGGLLLLTLAAASHRGWHQSIHNDAASDNHSCLITVFAHAQVDLSEGHPTPAPVTVPVAVEFIPPSPALFPEADFLSPPGRAPPRHS